MCTPLTVRTDTFRVQTDSLRYTVAVAYPQVRGWTRTVGGRMLNIANGAILDSVWAVARTFRPTEAVVPDAPAHEIVTVEGGPRDVFIGGEILSALVSLYAYTGGAHGNTVAVPINRDVRTGEALRLGNLFRPGTPWADTLSAYAERGLVRKMTQDAGMASRAEALQGLYAEGYGASAMRSVAFTLGADSLALHFVPYEVAFYAFGSTRVPVAYSDLAPLMRPDGVAARLRGTP